MFDLETLQKYDRWFKPYSVGYVSMEVIAEKFDNIHKT